MQAWEKYKIFSDKEEKISVREISQKHGYYYQIVDIRHVMIVNDT